jgi:hypothetical protein
MYNQLHILAQCTPHSTSAATKGKQALAPLSSFIGMFVSVGLSQTRVAAIILRLYDVSVTVCRPLARFSLYTPYATCPIGLSSPMPGAIKFVSGLPVALAAEQRAIVGELCRSG